MTWEILFMLVLLAVLLGVFISEKLPVELAGMGAFALLLVMGLLAPADALAVFSNAGPITVGAMFVISAALGKCGALELVGAGVAQMRRMSIFTLLPVVGLTVAGLSAFINNTPIVIVFLPILIGLAQKMDIPASKLLIPLSYASIFGGCCTLIGTSTNIIVSSMAADAGLEPFSMFELAAVGLPLTIVGTLYLTFVGHRLLPVRETVSAVLGADERREYIVEAYVTEESRLVGKSFSDTSLESKRHVRLLELLRRGVQVRSRNPSEIVLRAGDRLLLAMSPRAVPHAEKEQGLDLIDTLGEGLERISRTEGEIVEGILGPDSSLIGRTLGTINFRQRYRLVPMAVHRRGRSLRRDFDRVPLAYGDLLLLLGTSDAVEQLRGNADILLLEKAPLILNSKRKRLPWILLVIAAVIAVATAGLLPISAAAIVGMVLLLLTRCISTREAYDAIHWPILFLIFSMLGVGAAMESTGTSLWLANQMIAAVATLVTEPWQPYALLVGLYLLTNFLTEVLSNNAAAVILTSIGIGLASATEMDARPFLVAIAIAASASFATPIGYQTNTYVYSVGGYRFTDFARVGIPLNLIAFIVSMIMIPLVWSF